MSKMVVKPANAKNADENEKNILLGHMPLCVLKMGQTPKTLKRTELDKECHNRSISEEKMKDAVIR